MKQESLPKEEVYYRNPTSYTTYGALTNQWTDIYTQNVPQGDYLVIFHGIFPDEAIGYKAIKINDEAEISLNQVSSGSPFNNALADTWIVRNVNSIVLQAYGACNSFLYRYYIKKL